MRFATVNLALNIGGLREVGGDASECNPGGSYICTTGTKGCDAGLTCVGTSSKMGCDAQSTDIDFGFDARILVEREELAALQEQLQRVVMEFGAQRESGE